MRRTLGIAVGLLLIAGCNNKQEESTNTPSGSNKATAEAEVNAPNPQASLTPQQLEEERKQEEARKTQALIKRQSNFNPAALKIAPHGKGDWKTANIQPIAFAKGIDEKIRSLRNGIMQALLLVKIDNGGKGVSKSINILGSPKRYKLKHAVLSSKPGRELGEEEVIVENGIARTITTDAVIPGKPALVKATLENFALKFPALVLSPFGTNQSPFLDIVKEAQAKKWTQKFDKTFQSGQPASRLLLTSPKQDRIYEVVVTNTLNFPTTIKTKVKNKNGKWTELAWFGYWGVKPTPLTDADFKLTPETSPIARQPKPGRGPAVP